jgi:phosphoglycolate phosphatase
VTDREPPLVVLWDIDGTLMRSPGVGVRAFVAAVEEVTGRRWDPVRLDFGGRTDPDIAALLLAAVGVEDEGLVPAVLEALVRGYAALDADLQATVRVMPGVVAALDALALPGAVQTVVTGNIEVVARQKLTAARLVERVRMEWGAFGSDDHIDRAALVELAMARVAAGGATVERERVWVVGDTPRDLAAARAAGVRCLLVGTGAHAYDDLVGSGADAVLPDLAELAAVLAALAPGGNMTIP